MRGGVLVFTVEALPEGSADLHRLQTTGRYAHSPAHLRAALAAAGFELIALQAETLRMEGGEPVHGWLVTARRPASKAMQAVQQLPAAQASTDAAAPPAGGEAQR